MPDIEIPGQDPDEPPSSGLEVICHPTLGRDAVQFQQIVRYVESLKDGNKPGQAARQAGTTLGAMRQQGKAVQRYLARAKSDYAATAEELREICLLKWAERALKEPGDQGYDPRETMAALHELSQIPEVGLKGKTAAQVAVRQLSEETQSILDRVDEV